MKILLTKRRALGDTVLLSSTVAALKAALPAAEISVLVPRAFAPVLENNPAIARVLHFEAGWPSLVREIRNLKLDYLIQLHASPRTRWLGWVAGAQASVFHVQNAEAAAHYQKQPNALEWDAFCLREIFGSKVSLPAPPPQIFFTPDELAQGKAYWQNFGADPSRVVFLGLGASRITKRWPPAHFARLAELLRDRHELIPAIITGPGEEEARFAGLVIDEMRVRGFRPLGGPVGKGDFIHGANLSVRRLAQALSACRAYIGNDSGPKHMAVAAGCPTLTLFGPEDPVEWHPYSREAHPVLFIEGLACRKEDNGRWCGIPVCIEERHRCMVGLDPLEALAAFTRLKVPNA
ncbi:MAG: glycosyltransferase family 9 protein [Proteobacteria bacterium]|nr:MAG: glycosyltransferase family 9 protein [Pseudomonadota bacterium]